MAGGDSGLKRMAGGHAHCRAVSSASCFGALRLVRCASMGVKGDFLAPGVCHHFLWVVRVSSLSSLHVFYSIDPPTSYLAAPLKITTYFN